MWPWLLNTAWMLKCAPEGAAFARACRNVAETQARLLREIVSANRDTWFGRTHHFDRIADARSFQRLVPPATDADLAEPIERIARGEQNVLTAERVLLLEPTSGTTAGEKLIPYTAGLRRQFQRGVAAWIADLFRKRPAVRAGRAYWSLSPALGPPRRSFGGVPIGFDDDTAYLGRLERFALRKLLVVPGAVARLDLAAFRAATLRHLLAAKDVSLISVWSPTFLLALMDAVPDACAENLRAAWPKLALISCWTDAAAGQFVPRLRQLFPTVEIQPKGLLATEGFVSVPLIDEPGAALALRCHFFEFEELTGCRFRLAHELERGGRYRVLLTTAGGLYRYRLGDVIEVVGHRHQCPLLRFLGKSEFISDLVGEKLAETHVRTVVARLPLQTSFALLVPVDAQPPRYRLYVQGAIADMKACERALHGGLAENPYYRHAVGVGQLTPAEIVPLDPAKGSAWLVYERRCMDEGQRCGNIKPMALDRRLGWPERFAPLLLEPASECTGNGNQPIPASIP